MAIDCVGKFIQLIIFFLLWWTHWLSNKVQDGLEQYV